MAGKSPLGLLRFRYVPPGAAAPSGRGRHALRLAGTAAWKIIRLVLMAGLCYIVLYPFVVKLLQAFFTYRDFLDPTVRFIPKTPTLDNIVNVLRFMDYGSAFVETFGLSLAIGVLQMLIGALVGYGFARFHFRGNGFFFVCVIFTLIVPPQTLLIPLYRTFYEIPGMPGGLIDTPWPMLILALTGQGFRNGLYIFLYRQFFKNMPKELEDAAYIDGCGYFGTFVRIMLPPARSTMLTVFLFGFAWQWTDLFYTRLFNPNVANLVNAAMRVTSSQPILASMMRNTAALLVILPLFVLFAFAQKGFTQSIERSGIVG